MSDSTLIEQLREAAQLQLSELEMIQSMYPGAKEVTVDCPNSLLERQACDGDFLPALAAAGSVTRLDYTVNVTLDQTPVSLSVSLPPLYPFVPCNAVVRSQQLSRAALSAINTDLRSEIDRQEKGDLCVGTLLAWLSEQVHNNITQDAAKASAAQTSDSISNSSTNATPPSKKNKFCRMWIYSHHIYSKVKRKDLLELSSEYDLTGFMLPGKPGLICVEGSLQNTDTWWTIVRSWNWQKILCKQQETHDLTKEQPQLCCFRRFGKFQELGSEDEIRVKGGGYHVDMGDLFRYLKKHNSEYMFKEYFGVEGRD